LDNLEKSLQSELEKEMPNISRLKTEQTGMRMPKAATLSVAEQLLGVAEQIREIHKEIDMLQTEMTTRLDVLRNKLGSKS
jgi:hypothetical protein